MSLTDEWKAERLRKEKDYFVKTSCNGKIYPAHLYDDNSFSFCGNRTEYFPVEGTDIEVLAPCDYEERADHIDTMAKQGKKIERLKECIRTARDIAYSSTQDCPRCGFIDDLLTKALNESEGK